MPHRRGILPYTGRMTSGDFPRLFRYDDWANQEALRSLRALSEPPTRGVKIMAHIVNTQWVWMSRLKQDGHRVVVWPDFGLDECAKQLPVLQQAWEKYLKTRTPFDLGTTMEYVNTKGERWTSRVGDVLTHVTMHGAYHRGQIATLVRQAGGEPAYTDFVQAVRTGKI